MFGSQWEKETIQEIAANLLNEGMRVFIAERGTYGFFTDKEGSRVVSFQMDLGTVTCSGNYISRHCGTGWRYESGEQPRPAMLKDYAPHWATKGEQVKLATLDDHLKLYGKSSRYTEVFA